jgi:hypothetical protein
MHYNSRTDLYHCDENASGASSRSRTLYPNEMTYAESGNAQEVPTHDQYGSTTPADPFYNYDHNNNKCDDNVPTSPPGQSSMHSNILYNYLTSGTPEGFGPPEPPPHQNTNAASERLPTHHSLQRNSSLKIRSHQQVCQPSPSSYNVRWKTMYFPTYGLREIPSWNVYYKDQRNYMSEFSGEIVIK